tara:strand:- start:187 stop:972 length:786 start_codon:yes stop_codon:yes gene_type:complete
MNADNSEALLAKTIKSLKQNDFSFYLNRWLRTLANHDNTTILAYFRDETPQILLTDSETIAVHQNMSHVYLSGAYLLDPFYELHNSGADSNLYRMSDIAPDQFSRNQYFLEYYQRTTIIDEIAFIIWPSPQISIHVCLGRDVKSKRRFTIREISSTKQVLPIVETLVCKHWGNLRFSSDDHGENVLERMVRLVSETHNINLTKRQAEVALLVLRGHSSASIALRLEISPQTVKVFRKQLYRKCNISSQAELFALITPLLVN